MIKTGLLIVLAVLSLAAVADDKPAPTNFCHDEVNSTEFDQLLRKHPTDTGIIRLVALRLGLCAMIDRQQISLTTAGDLWALERQKILVERTQKLLNQPPKRPAKAHKSLF